MKPTVKYAQVNFVLIPVVFGIGWKKKGDALSPWLLTFAYAICHMTLVRSKITRSGFRMNGTHQLEVYTDNVNFFRENVNNIQRSTA